MMNRVTAAGAAAILAAERGHVQ